MKKLVLLFAILLPSLALAQTAIIKPITKAVAAAPKVSTWAIDPSHSSAGFKVRHLGISWVRGTFKNVSGEIVTDENDLTKTKVNVTIDVNSVDTGIEKRDNHLRTDDKFFDVKTYPNMTFVSTKVYKSPAGAWLVDGNLTMKNVTKPVTLALEGPTPPMKGPGGKYRSGISATTRINRKEFGVKWDNMVEAVAVVSDDVDIYIEAELVRKDS